MSESDRNCPTCGAGPSFVVPVWESEYRHRRGADPDYLGCTECCTMHSVDANSDRGDR